MSKKIAVRKIRLFANRKKKFLPTFLKKVAGDKKKGGDYIYSPFFYPLLFLFPPFFRKFLLIFPFLLAAISCIPAPPNISPEAFYKRDMILDVNGFKGLGAMVVPQADYYKFKITARGDLDLFVLSTCHRVISLEEAGEGGIFGNKRKVEIKFYPQAGIEDEACPVVLEGYELDKGRHSWGYVDFQEKKLQVLAKVRCNGEENIFKGVSVCQSSEKTLQTITFEKDMFVDFKDGCAPAKTSDNRTFSITLSPKLCIYGFIEKEDKKAFHRLTTLGFEKIMMRKN